MPSADLRPPVPNFTLNEAVIGRAIDNLGKDRFVVTFEAVKSKHGDPGEGAGLTAATKVGSNLVIAAYAQSTWAGQWTTGARAQWRW